jgi:GR25 family glycosyltransferase involved in LPS biosynthesis
MSEDEMNILELHGRDDFTIKAYIITMLNDNVSVVATRHLINSIYGTQSRIQPFIVSATIPRTIGEDIKNNFSKEYGEKLYKSNGDLNWTWPIHSSEDGIDFATGLYKKAYSADDWRKVAACMISHMKLWQHCVDSNEPIMILEHDAIFIKEFRYRFIALCGEKWPDGVPIGFDNTKPEGQWTGGICGLNNPLGATRKGRIFDNKAKQHPHGLQIVPYVDEIGDLPLPSGLAGNSAYIIKPWAAKKLLDKVLEVGLWPNDALMCRQFFPWIQIYTPYFTKIQQITSTTTT